MPKTKAKAMKAAPAGKKVVTGGNPTEIANDPATVRRLFETGEYPYKRKLRRPEYEVKKPIYRLSC